MPEIMILKVNRWSTDGGTTYTVDDASGYEIQSETADFGVNDLAELGAEYGVTRWSEATDEDREAENKVSYIADKLVLVGWVDAPIGRDDVEMHHDYGTSLPAVNIKVYDTTLPDGEAFDALVEEHELDSRLAALPRADLRSLIEGALEKDNDWFEFACESGFEWASEQAVELFSGHNIKVSSAGRSGGWLVIDGLPDVAHWGVDLLTKWAELTELCKAGVKDIPRAMAWQVLANGQDELAGRVIRVEVTLVVADADFEQIDEEDPAKWDWHDMLDLSRETEIRVRRLDH